MTALAQVRNYFLREPINLSIIYTYFPNLSNLFISALAATADYNYSEDDKLNNIDHIIDQMFKSFGVDEQGNAIFKPTWAIKNFTTAQKISRAIKRVGTPPNTPPATPDAFHLRIGAANFYVPPVSINVSTGFKTGSLTGGAIRQKSSPKFNSGHRETTISMRLYFPNYEEVWGISIDDASKIVVDSAYKVDFQNTENTEKIDKFLSSLRGLVAAFKYSPILPIKNHYLNSVHGITGVALSSMSISTVPDYPFALMVDIELFNFNHKPLLPMLNDFNQSIHWGKYRQYMGKAAGSMYNYINEDFILESDLNSEASKKTNATNPNSVINSLLGGPGNYEYNQETDETELALPYNEETNVLSTNVYQDWQDGKNLALYVPAKVQSKIYTPDESAFRTAEEAALTDVGRGTWEGLLKWIGIDVNESANYHRTLDSVVETARSTTFLPSTLNRARSIVSVALAGVNSKDIRDKIYAALAQEYISNNNIKDKEVIEYLTDTRSHLELEIPSSVGGEQEQEALFKVKQALFDYSKNTKGHLSYAIELETDKRARKRKIEFTQENKRSIEEWVNIQKVVEKELVDAFNVTMYQRFYGNSDIQSILEAARDKAGSFSFREWDVPMIMVDLDERSVIVNSISVTMSNKLAKMQLQMQEEPTFQHIGSGDSYVSISMTVFGEKELIKIKKTFDFLSGLARLEKAAGVIGFMGIKNVITALSGIKYVMPLTYEVDTIPNYPHAYSVRLVFVDFDVYQQKREKLSSDQQRKFIEEFKTKRNPFLRLKQNWSVFNAYPDMPLMVKDEEGNVLGSLDPDFYFRSFEMMDQDVVNSIIDPENFKLPLTDGLGYEQLDETTQSFVQATKARLIENRASLTGIRDFLINTLNLKPSMAMEVFRHAIFDANNDTQIEKDFLSDGEAIGNKFPDIWQDFVDSFIDEFGVQHTFADLKFETRYGAIKIGELTSGSKEQIESFNALVKASSFDLAKGELPSIDPDELEFAGVLHYIPSAESSALDKIPTIMQTPDGGFVLGYSSEQDGRFYIAADSLDLTYDANMNPIVNGVKTIPVADTSSPDRDPQNSHTGVTAAQPLQSYMNPYTSSKSTSVDSNNSGGSYKGPGRHWEKMMMDTQYRDISGRMVRAFPTYMLWLIDEGNYFSGVKLFDNFYGLQSVIDFSIVQSEDILGDTLILRVSNAYQKLTRPELTLNEIVSSGGVVNQDNPNLTEGTVQIIDILLNTARNFTNHFDSQYITEIENVRLRPGVRVHLRGGYGANPNSLQTLFNGVITTVENGEIVTITAQSDAIELSPIINSSNKKGDSGKIDGGINTGLWLSEPRDLMVRLLSMGSSRIKEQFAHATRGTIFSENKFGIRHFGSILYAPLTERERIQASEFRASAENAANAVGNNPVSGSAGLAFNGTVNSITGATAIVGGPTGLESAGGSVRTPVVGLMRTMWANLNTSRDLEIFKRNIYPGNGIGVAQFMGGDIDDGWSSLVSVDEEKIREKKFGYMDRLSDSSWSRLLEQAGRNDNNDASRAIERLTESNSLVDSSGAVGTGQVLSGVLTAATLGAGLAIGGPIAIGGSLFLGGGLVKNMFGRGGASVWKTLGMVSDLDDDIYDEVSFRAQTYMRSVWDMFQLCARLLPNYIVAVRPFEDRSTIFYGKPHWLYTSGVVPISTGYPNENQARKDGTSIPGWISDNDEASRIMSEINKETSPLADASAFSAASESNLSSSLAQFAKDSLSFQNVFAPGDKLYGKVVNFKDNDRNYYYENGAVKSILPVNEGKVQVGFHLPFGGKKGEIIAPIQQEHKQLDFLPIRYRYPFFTNRTTGALPSLDFDRIIKADTLDDLNELTSNLVEIAKLEKNIINDKDGKTKLVSKDQSSEYQLNFNFDFARYVSGFSSTSLEGNAIFDPSGINTENISGLEASLTIMMPLPVVTQDAPELRKNSEGYYEFNDDYKDIYQDLDFAYQRNVEFNGLNVSFSDWGMPEDADKEQFHIAMRWPYDPISSQANAGIGAQELENLKKNALSKFINDYDLGKFQLTGTADDYKKRKVLVYNPQTKQAVVCAPAYFLWGKTDPDGDGKIEAIVSPDAAFALGLLVNIEGQINAPQENLGENSVEDDLILEQTGLAEGSLQKCYFTFVEDDVPVGIVTSGFSLANTFTGSGNVVENAPGLAPLGPGTASNSVGDWVVGFGRFIVDETYDGKDKLDPSQGDGAIYKYDITNPHGTSSSVPSNFTGIRAYYYSHSKAIRLLDQEEYSQRLSRGGNVSEYFEIIRDEKRLDELKEQTLIDLRNKTKKENTYFAEVYDQASQISVEARGMWDETFDSQIKVIAGNGRTPKQAQDIWDQFRWGYHTYESVKTIFASIYGMDPDDDDPNSQNPIIRQLSSGKSQGILEEFAKDNNAYNEFAVLLGADWVNNENGGSASGKKQALDISIREYVDSGFDGVNEDNTHNIDEETGIIDILNSEIQFRLSFIVDLIKNNVALLSSNQYPGQNAPTTTSSTETEQSNAQGQSSGTNAPSQPGSSTSPATSNLTAEDYLANVKSPKQLFLLLVGLFRQKLWQDPYSRAWLVLKPDRKRWVLGDASQESDSWSFRSVDKIFQAFIDYNSTYAKDNAKFKKLLQSNAKEGNSATNWMSGIVEDSSNFYDRNIGPIFDVFQSAIGNLLNMFRLSMSQLGYGLSQVDNFAKQANILNKAYNDSIYYSLGRPGTLLRAVDNPFTREYGEPVVEVREPFQKIHYLSSFTHIIANGIQENIGNVATQITAVSDGQYPVTVALDKAAPSERQVEKTVETGLYFDNIRGSGFFGVLHPVMHPLQTVRGISKAISGEPDELTARRVALSHLKESIKDIYGGEIVVIGNADIRPHDLVYLADVYERMYGLFEVEQVVHHFTPDMGFVTSITPNAFVTVNDPARWFMSSWISSRFSMQNMRNDTRNFMASASAQNLVNADGQISLDSISESLSIQMKGGLMYTHGHSAIVKDIVANIAAEALPNVSDQIKAKIKASTGRQEGSGGAAIAIAVGGPLLTTAATAIGAVVGGPVGAAVGFSGGAIVSDLAWSAWKWTRDNVLDQHGCYVQYLNRNGQAMDAGLSFNQGMVVGRYHSKKLIPKVLGVRTQVRTAEGNSYIRLDDLLKSIGYREKEISDLIRYVSLENAIINSQVLKYSGIGPEKASLNQLFKVIALVTKVFDGDTFVVEDILTRRSFVVRFDGINTSELAQTNINAAVNTGVNEVVFNPATAAGQALKYTFDAVNGKLVVLRIPPKSNSSIILTEDDFEAGSGDNTPENYATAIKGKSQADTGYERYMATIFHQGDGNSVQRAISLVRGIFIKRLVNNEISEDAVKNEAYAGFYETSMIKKNFSTIYNSLKNLPKIVDYFESSGESDPLNNITIDDKKTFSVLVSMFILEKIYQKASEWPLATWDEYYSDGTPLTLNWELVVNGLAKVYTKGLLFADSPAVIPIEDQIPIPERVNN